MTRPSCLICAFALLSGPAMANELDDMIAAFEAGNAAPPYTTADSVPVPAPEPAPGAQVIWDEDTASQVVKPDPVTQGVNTGAVVPMPEFARPMPPDPSADWATHAAYIRARLAWAQAQREAAATPSMGDLVDDPS